LLGSALLFWGATTDRLLVGFVIALLVEARHWTRFRWEFDDEAYGRAWQFTSLAIALAAVVIWLEGNRYTALPGLLSWLPPLLLPMQFVQTYGMRDSLPVSVFSFLARQRRVRNERLGLIEVSADFNFGNVLFVTTLVASTVGSRADTWWFLPGVVVLTGWMLLASGSRALSMLPALALAGVLGIAGQLGLERVEGWFGRSSGSHRGRFDPNSVYTMIGSRGTVQQSPDIVWRLHLKENTRPPTLLRTATFNSFLAASWQNQRRASNKFEDLDTFIGEEDFYLLQSSRQGMKVLSLPSFTLRGEASGETPLPLPGDTAGLRDFGLDGAERNPTGTVRIFPKHSVIEGTVFWHGDTNPEGPPLGQEEIRIPISEREVIHEVAKKLRLDTEPDLHRKLSLIRNWFQKDFRYTRHLKIEHQLFRTTGTTAIGRFLTRNRTGHCEYFATAATLILRDAGIPARYAIGYAVIEKDTKRDEFLIRGTHGHAWCRVWNPASGLWIDFDPTPPDWSATISQEPSLMQQLGDYQKRMREDFALWRNRPSNRLAVSLAMTLIGLALAGFVMRRLWKSKRLLESRNPTGTYQGSVVRTPLHDLETQARKLIGQRPPGLPFGEWLARLRPALQETLTLDEAIDLHQRIRFDPEPPAAGSQERLAILAKQLHVSLNGK
jgi:hypothetical protein